MDKLIRILLVEDHVVMRAALRSLLDANKEITVVGEADNGRQMMGLIDSTAPDVVVMDINMPELNGIDATRQLCARSPHIKVLGIIPARERAHGFRNATQARGAMCPRAAPPANCSKLFAPLWRGRCMSVRKCLKVWWKPALARHQEKTPSQN